jgi:hypothetical protein
LKEEFGKLVGGSAIAEIIFMSDSNLAFVHLNSEEAMKTLLQTKRLEINPFSAPSTKLSSTEMSKETASTPSSVTQTPLKKTKKAEKAKETEKAKGTKKAKESKSNYYLDPLNFPVLKISNLPSVYRVSDLEGLLKQKQITASFTTIRKDNAFVQFATEKDASAAKSISTLNFNHTKVNLTLTSFLL